MSDDDTGDHVPDDEQYGHHAMLDRDFESLTPKQRRGVQGIVEADEDMTRADVAEQCDVSPSYLSYIEKHFPHILDRRKEYQVAADGGDDMVTIRVRSSQVWEIIRATSKATSTHIFNQVREGSSGSL